MRILIPFGESQKKKSASVSKETELSSPAVSRLTDEQGTRTSSWTLGGEPASFQLRLYECERWMLLTKKKKKDA